LAAPPSHRTTNGRTSDANRRHQEQGQGHLQLDEITDQVRLWYDDVAERLATLDVAPDGRLATVAAGTPLPAAGKGWQKDVDAVTVMRDRLGEVAGRLERRAGEIGDSDLVTQGILLVVAGGLQKHAWMLRVQAR